MKLIATITNDKGASRTVSLTEGITPELFATLPALEQKFILNLAHGQMFIAFGKRYIAAKMKSDNLSLDAVPFTTAIDLIRWGMENSRGNNPLNIAIEALANGKAKLLEVSTKAVEAAGNGDMTTFSTLNAERVELAAKVAALETEITMLKAAAKAEKEAEKEAEEATAKSAK